MDTLKLIRYLLSIILLFDSLCLIAQEISVSPGFISAPYTPAGEQIRILAYHHPADGDVQLPTLTFQIEEGEQLYVYDQSFDQAQRINEAVYSSGRVELRNAPLDRCYFLARPSQMTMARRFYWIFDYAPHALTERTLQALYDPDLPCQQVLLQFSSPPTSIEYITPAGRRVTVDRGLKLRYQDLIYDSERHSFFPIERTETINYSSGSSTLRILASLADTDYQIIGDRFSQGVEELYGLPLRSQILPARRLELHARYTRIGEVGKNEEVPSSTLLSAPETLQVELIANEPAAMLYQIYITKSNGIQPNAPIVLQYSGTKVEHTFREMGTFTLYGKVSDRTSQCTIQSDPQIITIQDSYLEVPNVFTPHSSPGVNDTFQVAHRSLVSFEAYIFDSWGTLLYHWSDPDLGWDGTYQGRPVPTGVYYYVIQAEGADGVRYNERGDVNILESDISSSPESHI